MNMFHRRFNIYLALGLGLLLLPGCSTTSDKKQTSILRIHLETNRDGTDRTKPVPIYRDKAYLVNVESSPFLTEANVSEARIVEAVGGFALEIKFERRGAWLLEEYSTANRGRRFGIYAEFKDPADPKKVTARWLAAPLNQQRNATGIITFTPDASREEAAELVKGLNNLAKKLNDSYSW